MRTGKPLWKKKAAAFEKRAEEYDSWFADNPLFENEMAALRAVKEKLPRPFVEIGVGPGRFARALRTDYGIDPAMAPLRLAGGRDIAGVRAIGEQLPFRPGCVGTVFILFTLCFLADPDMALRECARVLRRKGRLVLGLIPARSRWGREIVQKKEKGNPFYRHAELRTIGAAEKLLAESGFSCIESWSTLFQPPGSDIDEESPRRGRDENAGFCVLVMKKKEETVETPQPDHADN
jgi:SAM-dependent methyltransferase